MNGPDLVQHYDACLASGMRVSDIAKRLGVCESTLTTRVHRAGSKAGWSGKAQPLQRLPDPLTLGGDAIVVGDVHSPTFDHGMIARVEQVRTVTGITRLIIAGDMMNMDTFSSYPDDIAGPTWQQERDHTKDLFDHWLARFAQVVWVQGNHDRRFVRRHQVFDYDDLASLVCNQPTRLTVTPYGWCNLVSNGVNYRITHPRNYSVRALQVADDLAVKFNTNIIAFHEHHWGVAKSRYNNHVIINGGCLADYDSFAYAVLDDGTNPQSYSGFVGVKGGYATLYDDGTATNWDALGNQ